MALSKEVKLDIALALYAIIKFLQAEVSHTEAIRFPVDTRNHVLKSYSTRVV